LREWLDSHFADADSGLGNIGGRFLIAAEAGDRREQGEQASNR